MSEQANKKLRFRKYDTIYYYDLSDHERHSKQVYYKLARAGKKQHKALTSQNSIARRVKRRHRRQRKAQHKSKILSMF